MADIVKFPGTTKWPIPVEQILGDALAEGMETAIVIGWDSQEKFWFSSSAPDIGEVLYLLFLAHKKLQDTVPDDAI